jgi:hypothetical protein
MIVCDRIPGGIFTFSIVGIVVIRLLRMSDVPAAIVNPIGMAWLFFCLYTWLIDPIASMIERWRST